jgi:hypothetical protein
MGNNRWSEILVFRLLEMISERRVAQVVFPRGNAVMQMRDTLGPLYTDEAFADPFPTHGQPALAPVLATWTIRS